MSLFSLESMAGKSVTMEGVKVQIEGRVLEGITPVNLSISNSVFDEGWFSAGISLIVPCQD